MNENNNGSSIVSFFVGFILGALVGAGTALLMAPQSGEETRTMIHDKSIELKDKAAVTTDEWAKLTQQRATELQERGQVILEEQKARFSTEGGDVEVIEETIVVAEVSPEEEGEE